MDGESPAVSHQFTPGQLRSPIVRANRAKKVQSSDFSSLSAIRMNVPGVERPQSPHFSNQVYSESALAQRGKSQKTVDSYRERQILFASQDQSLSINTGHHHFTVPHHEENQMSDNDD